MDLFREEVEAYASVLTSGLLAIESSPAGPERIEPLMRAAHSLKGAARVMGFDAAVGIAHALEDVLIAVQEGRLPLNRAGVDLLLQGVDWLTALAKVREIDLPAWLVLQADTVGELESRLLGLKEGQEPGPGEAPVRGAAGETHGATRVPLPEALGAEARGGTTVTVTAAEPEPARDRSVKMSAEVLNRFIHLVSETLVEAHRMETLVESWWRLRQRQQHLSAWLRRELLDQGAVEDAIRALETAGETLSQVHRAFVGNLDELEGFSRRLAVAAERLFQDVVASRMRPFAEGIQALPRLVRDLSHELGKQVKFEIQGQNTQVDRDILQKLEAPLGHLLRNAVDHGIETPQARLATGKAAVGSVRLEAHHRGGMLSIIVSDDGRGVDRERLRRKIVERNLTTEEWVARISDAELLDFLFLPGLSTREVADRISGRGVGLDTVRAMVHAEGGAVSVASEPGRGTTFHLRLPVTRSVARVLLVTVAGEPYAFPLARIGRVIECEGGEIRTVEGRGYVVVEGVNVALVPLRELLEFEPAPPNSIVRAVVLADGEDWYALEVDGFLGERELVVRPLDVRLGKVPHLAAAAVLEDGLPVLVLDAEDVMRSVVSLLSGGRPVGQLRAASGERTRRARRILVVDDSITVRELERRLLQNEGYEVDVAVDGMEAWNTLRLEQYDLVVSDVDMPRLDGIELVKRIRADARLGRIPVMIVSYKDRPEDRMAGLQAGADYYLAKSGFRDDTLIQAVRQLIGEASACELPS
jgi:two-component system sensor histidine kinase and response regulator WspE